MDLVRSGLILLLAGVTAVAYLWLSAKNKYWSTSRRRSKGVEEHSAKGSPLETRQNRSRPPLEILYHGPADGAAEADIIAVHGLGANVDWSWTWKDGDQHINWLREPYMLPAKVPKSRIIMYNYESRWHADAPNTRLQLCGEELVRSVHNLRNGMLDRPIIFIGHSLGGLVVQHGLLYADRKEGFRYLLGLTVGLVALGSPFRGTKMQSIADLAAQFMVLAGSHRGIITDLAFDNPYLRDKLQEFCQLRDMQLITCCFFETYETDYGRRFWVPGLFRGMVVGEESACIPGWERRPLQTDHLKMNKFSGPQDRSFLSVAEWICKMCADSKAVIERRKNLPQSHWVVPFGRNGGFVGRESILQQLLERIPPGANKDDCQRTAIEGLGGVGKTQIALEAAFRLRDKHPDCSVFWVPAVDTTSFENAYREIGQRLGVAGIDEDKADVKVLVKAALSCEDVEKWLLIVDNADDLRLLYGEAEMTVKTTTDLVETLQLARVLPFSRKGSIIFTTRTRRAAVKLAGRNLVTVGAMDPGDARELLETGLADKLSKLDEESTTRLLDLLTNLPLAIRQASAYMNEQQISTAKYLKRYESSNKTTIKLLSKHFEDEARYENIKNPVATTWLISFEHISRNPLAAQYLRFMCFLAEKDIPGSLLPSADDELEADEAVGTLKAYAFITQREGQDSFDIHRLVRLVMRNWLDEKGQLQECYRSVLRRLAEAFPFPKHENRKVWMKYLPHAQAALESGDDATQGESDLLYNVAESYSILGKYKEAEAMYRQTLELREKALGEEHPDTLASMNNLAEALRHQGKYEEAEAMHRQTLELREKVLGKEHPSTLGSMNNLALVLESLGKYEEVEAMHRQTLKLREKVLGEEHPSTLGSMNNLANVLYSLGKYEEAEAMHRQILELKEKVLGKEHPDTVRSRNNLADCVRARGQKELQS